MGLFDFFKTFTVIKRKELEDKNSIIDRFTKLDSSVRPDLIDTGVHRVSALSPYSFHNVTERDLRDISDYSDIIRNTFRALANELFRNGFEVEPLVEGANEADKEKIDEFLACANNNNQSFKEVLLEFENDLNTHDNAYLLMLKDYLFNNDNEIVGGLVNEVIRIDPLNVKMVVDKQQRLGRNENNDIVYFNIKDRAELTDQEFNKKTGMPNLQAHFVVHTTEGEIYYNRSEVIHASKYKPSKTYGHSPLYALYNKVMILLGQDYYVRQYYGNSRPPKSLLFVNSKNKNSFMAMWDEFLQRLRRQPHHVHPILTESPDGKKLAEYINFMNNLQEMQYTEVRNEIRQQIGATYGVTPIFMNDVSTSGGLNNEGLQITVTNRAVESGQAIYNEKIFKQIIEDGFGITQWKLKLLPSEEEDEAAEEDLRHKQILNAKEMAELGIKVKLDDNGKFIYTPGDVELQNSQQGGFFPQLDEDSSFNRSAPLLKVTNPVPTDQQEKYKSALEKELTLIIKELDLKNKPSESQLKKIVDKVSKRFENRLNTKSATFIKTIYEKSMREVEKDLGEKFQMDDSDKLVIEQLKHDPEYRKAFSNVSVAMSNRLKEVIEKRYSEPESFTINSLVKDMREELDKSEGSLRTIARTETSKISVASRFNNYQKSSNFKKFKFKHIGPSDNRTTKLSEEVKSLTKDGVTWNQYVKIIKQVSKKFNDKWIVNDLAPITHPNTRHTFVRMVN
jgi:hypothetical protein